MMKKTTLALALSAVFSMNYATAQDAQPNVVNITINNVGDDTGLEMGTGSRARGQGSIATGKNSVAIGKNAVATGGNENKDSITQKLNENKQKLADIATAEANTNRLLGELQNIRKVEADVIEAGERVKQVRLAKQSAYNVWQDKLKTYNDTVAGSAQFLKDAQAKVDDLNSRLTGISRIQNVDISSDEGLTNAATQLKAIAEEGTTLNLSVDFYKDYVSSYYTALGEARILENESNNIKQNIRFPIIEALKSQVVSGTPIAQNVIDTYNNTITKYNISLPVLNLDNNYVAFVGYDPFYDYDDTTRLIQDGEKLRLVRGRDIAMPTVKGTVVAEIDDVQRFESLFKNKQPTDIEFQRVITKTTYENQKEALKKIRDSLPELLNQNHYFLDEDNSKARRYASYLDNSLMLKEYALDIAYYQTMYEETKNTTWLDKKVEAFNKAKAIAMSITRIPSLYNGDVTSFDNQIYQAHNAWYKENVSDVLLKNKVTTQKLTQELEEALGINKNAIAEKEAEIARLKTAADQAKSTYDNTNPSDADIALSQRYEEIMRQLTAKANELKSEQDRLQALRDALTLNDLTNVGENAYAIGTNALATGANSLAIGTDTIVTGENSIAMGKGSVVTGTNSIAIGTGHNVLGNNSGAFGDPDYIYGDGSYAFGNNNTIGEATNPHNSGNNTFVLGSNVVTKANNAVILGANSADGGDNTVSVGSATAQRKIVYVADGTISQTSKDAINGSQIYDILQNGTNVNVGTWKTLLGVGSTSATGDSATATALNNLAADVAKHLGGGATVDGNGRVTSPTYSITDVTGESPTVQNYSNVGAALTALDSNTKALNTILGNKADKTDITNINTSLDGINTALNGKANTSLNNITSDGETVIKNLAKGAVKVIAGTNTTVTESTDGDAKTYAVNVSNEAIKGAVQKDLDSKANKDASNLITTDVQKWQEKLGNGKNTKGDKGLITGDTLNTALTAALSDKANKTDITNINTSLDGINTALNGKANTNLNNLTTDGETVIKNLAKGAVKVIAGTNTTVTESTDGDAKTYAVNVSNEAIKGAVQKDLDGKANKDASNLITTDVQKWQEKLGNGKNAKGDKGLITGDTLNTALTAALSDKADKTDITNINTSLDGINTALNGKANTNLNNLTTDGKTVIKNLAKGAVKVVAGTNTTVTEGTDGNAKTYAVNVSNDTIKGAVQKDLDSKANKDASNLITTDVQKWQEKLGNGKNAKGDKGLITGDTLNISLETKADKSDVTNIKTDFSRLAGDVAQHLGGGATAVDGRVTTPTYSIKDVTTNATGVYNSVGGAIQALDRNTQVLSARMNSMTGDIQSLRGEVQTLRKDAFAGTASAMAIAGLGQSTQPGKTSVSMSGSAYRGQNAYALGISRMSSNGKFLLKGAVSGNNRGHYGGVVSATYTFD
ncbi:YadA-like family protein [Pelistega sp. MC2]|uniref:YadA-like family protein n=1 Tax=Pelistega sp. MC2 TaxID=1720297 RepID=UPI0008DA3538|nr:YadA-like family protein [Pelistega sp. MC2]